MHQELGRPSLSEYMLPEGLGQNERLERIEAAVDWERMGELVAGIYGSERGRPSYPPLLMVKVLLLQQWYNLSDPVMEEMLRDRLSFRRFVGLGLADKTPDHSTLSRFRVQIAERGLSEALFAELGAQFEERGLVVKNGTLLDATLVEAQVRRPPVKAGLGKKGKKDPDADWTRSGAKRQAHYGYKAHVGMDLGSGLVRRAELTPAKVSESEVADRLVCGDEAAAGMAAVTGDRRLHHAPVAQAPAGIAAVAAGAQRADSAGAGGGEAGVRHAEAELRLPAGALPRPGPQRRGGVVQTDNVQPADGGDVAGTRGLTEKGRAETAGTRFPHHHSTKLTPARGQRARSILTHGRRTPPGGS